MSFSTGYRGVVGGAVQATYYDQPDQAQDGMLAFAGDLNLCDACYVDQANGIACGRGVTAAAVSDSISLQRPNLAVSLPTVAADADAFYGFLVYDNACQSDENGIAGVANDRMGLVLRRVRHGGRIYVRCPGAVTVGSSTVNWVTVAGTDGAYEAGEFAPSALAGTEAAGTSVALTFCTWVQGCGAGGLGIIEVRP